MVHTAWLLVALLVARAGVLARGEEPERDSLADDSQWSDYVRGDRLRLPDTVPQRTRKRSLEMTSAASGRTFGSLSKRCEAPGQRRGRCMPVRLCRLDEFKANVSLVLDYLCVINHKLVGVCCPESRPGLSPLGGGILPAILGALSPTAANTTTRPAGAVVPRPTNRPPVTTPSANRGCGVSSLQGARIVGGQPADLKEWPWMVALVRAPDLQFCGGVLVTDRHVLTAAHCVQSMELKSLRVRLGEYDLSTTSESPSRDFGVAEVRAHEAYAAASYENDIALLRMSRPTAFNNYIWPVCLPPPAASYSGKQAVVIGWGTVSFGGPASITLMEVEVPVWNLTYCKTRFTQPVRDTNLCAGAYEGGKDSCQGDSGGPLLHQLDNGRWVTIGVVSWGIRCGDRGRPGVYTRVDQYLDWILDNAVF
ncbi:venom protease-like [Bacillus rossius redtenbacheri]|uniref:venom protease-like n=1 Tax=Bacillus rossius redtenbacheri TaxID=93214 RepID=UPI002FDCA24B